MLVHQRVITKGWNPATFGNMTSCAVFLSSSYPMIFSISIPMFCWYPTIIPCIFDVGRPRNRFHAMLCHVQQIQTTTSWSRAQGLAWGIQLTKIGDIWECNIINHDYARCQTKSQGLDVRNMQKLRTSQSILGEPRYLSPFRRWLAAASTISVTSLCPFLASLWSWKISGGFLKWGYPNSWMLYNGKTQS